MFEGHTIYSVLRGTLFGELSLERLLGIAALGVPLGFLFSQIYFLFYWRPNGFRLLPIDRGGTALVGFTDLGFKLDEDEKKRLKGYLHERTGRLLKDIPEPVLAWRPSRLLRPFFPWRRHFPKDVPKPQELDYVHNFYLAVFAWCQALQGLKDPKLVDQRLGTLTDIFHSLATARVALWAAGIAYGINEIGLHYVRTGGWAYLEGFVVAVFIVLVVAVLFSSCRRRVLDEMIFLMHDVIYAWLKEEGVVAQDNGQR